MEVVFQGTTVKLMLTAQISSEDTPELKECDFDVFVWASKSNNEQSPKPTTAMHIAKEECVMKDENNFVVEVSTEGMGAGYIVVRMEIQVPDEDCESGYRKEVLQMLPNLQIV